jgi:HEAT repeat protein
VALTVVALLATVSVGAALVLRTPFARAYRALADGKPRQALELLAEEVTSPDVLLLRARALHALSRHDDEMASFVELTRLFPARMARTEPLAHVIEHLGGPASGRAQEVLAQLGKPAVDALAKAAVEKSARRRWAALEVLRGLGEERRADLVASYIADLDLRECAVVKGAARRLGDLGDPRAVAPLRAVAIRKGADLFGNASEACEAGAARAALKKLGEGKEPAK